MIGVAANDPTAVAVANTAADQLRNVGIVATVSALDPVVLYGDALANNRVDAVVGWHRAGGDLATALASRYGCPALEATPVPTLRPLRRRRRHHRDAAPAASTARRPPTATPTTPAAAPEAGALVQAPSNITGVCDRSSSRESMPPWTVRRTSATSSTPSNRGCGSLSTVLPILQDNTIVAAGPSVQNVSLSGAIPVGIVGDAGSWVKSRQ